MDNLDQSCPHCGAYVECGLCVECGVRSRKFRDDSYNLMLVAEEQMGCNLAVLKEIGRKQYAAE